MAVAAECVSRGWSVRELARRAELPNAAVARLISGETPNPSIRTVDAILRALGKSWAWLDGV